MPRSADVIENALSWQGVPWRHQGRSRSGIDCIGLVITLAHELGLSDFDTHAYNRSPDGVNFLSGFKSHMDRVPPGDEKPGDVVVLRDQTLPCHCGILVWFRNTFYLVHAAAKSRKVVMDLFDGDLKSRKIAIFRYRGLEE